MRLGVVFLHAFLGTQLLLGGAAYWAIMTARDDFQPSLLYVVLTVAHVLGGALTLAASANLTLKCFRLIRPASFAADTTGAHVAGRTTAG